MIKFQSIKHTLHILSLCIISHEARESTSLVPVYSSLKSSGTCTNNTNDSLDECILGKHDVRQYSGYNTHLDKPRLKLVIDNDVIAVALEAVFVVDHNRLFRDRKQRKR